MGYQLAEKNGLAHRFNKHNGMAGKDWVKAFLSRHSDLTVRSPEPTSGARAMGFNRVAVGKFFALLNQILDTYGIKPDRIFNCDETGVSVNPKHQSKIVASKGKRQVGIKASAERGQTVCPCVLLSSRCLYAAYACFSRVRMQEEFQLGLPPGAWAEVHESASGWMVDLFYTWFKEFVKFSKSTKSAPVLSILDGHATHTKNLEVINTARQHGVIILCLPPHSSHKLQPLDVAFMNYEEQVKKWLRCNQVSSLFGAAFIQAATMKTAINGFRKTGIWPPDQRVFSDSDFLPAETTDIQNEGSVAANTTPKKNHQVEAMNGAAWMPDTLPKYNKRTSAFGTSSPKNIIPIT